MKSFWFATFIVISLNSVGWSQVKYAPTVEQCRADQRLWMYELEQGNMNAPYSDLKVQTVEMGGCDSVDPKFDLRTITAYQNTMLEIQVARLNRLEDFLDRHPEIRKQFETEDAARKASLDPQ